MPRFLIYALVDPRSGQWRYVGKSSDGLKRPCRHAYLSTKERNHKAGWIRGLLATGLTYSVEVLEELPSADGLYEAEQEWIARAREAWVPLTNLTDGGAGPWGRKHTPEARAKISATRKTPEVRARVVAALRARRHSAETRAKISATQKGRCHLSPEARARMAASQKLRLASPEARQRMANSLRGRTIPPDVRAKMSASQIAHCASPEVRAKRAAAARVRWAKYRESKCLS